jgi:hypothetical protein
MEFNAQISDDKIQGTKTDKTVSSMRQLTNHQKMSQ